MSKDKANERTNPKKMKEKLQVLILYAVNWEGAYGLHYLRTVPTIVIAHIRSAHLQILRFPIANAY